MVSEDNKKGRPSVLYVCPFDFAGGPAPTRRVFHIGEALTRAGMRVEYATVGGGDPLRALCAGSAQPEVKNTTIYERVELPERLLNFIPCRFSAGRQFAAWFESRPAGAWTAVIIYAATFGHAYWMFKACRRRNIPVVIDCTEWHSPFKSVFSLFDLSFWDCQFRMRWLYPKAPNIISISEVLDGFFRAKGGNSIRVPTLIDTQAGSWRAAEPSLAASPAIRLAYVGTSYRDDLNILVEGVHAARKNGVEVTLDFFGPDQRQLRSALCAGTARRLEANAGAIKAHGRVPPTSIPMRLAHHDFGLIVHPKAVWSDAGCPTKMPEYLALGLPIIFNPTGDIGTWVRDGIEGVALAQYSAAGFREAFERIASLPLSKRGEMKVAARRRAEDCFDYRIYAGPLEQFLSGLRKQTA